MVKKSNVPWLWLVPGWISDVFCSDDFANLMGAEMMCASSFVGCWFRFGEMRMISLIELNRINHRIRAGGRRTSELAREFVSRTEAVLPERGRARVWDDCSTYLQYEKVRMNLNTPKPLSLCFIP